MQRHALILSLLLITTAGARATTLEDFEMALTRLDLSGEQSTLVDSARVDYHRDVSWLIPEKERLTAALISGRGSSSFDQIASMIRLEARLLSSFVMFRSRVNEALKADQRELLDALVLRIRGTLAGGQEGPRSVAF